MSNEATEKDVGLAGDDGVIPEHSPLEGRVTPEPYVPLRFIDVILVLPATHPVVVLEELAEPYRQLRIPIGMSEAMAIAYAARGIATPKPLTHELFCDVLGAFGATLEVVRITKVEKSSYDALVILSSTTGSKVLACRPSDAIALALRQEVPAPITAAPEVLDQAGFTGS